MCDPSARQFNPKQYTANTGVVSVSSLGTSGKSTVLFYSWGAHPYIHHIKQRFRFSPTLWRCDPTRVMASSFLRFLDHTQWRTTVGRNPLDEWSARRRDLYLTTHNTHSKHPCPRWNSNPRFRQASGRRPTPYTARPLGPAKCISWLSKL